LTHPGAEWPYETGLAAPLLALLALGTPVVAQRAQRPAVTAADYARAEKFLGMKELAQKYPWIDLSRAGIWGHSGGGFATTTAMFRFPDFFKAGIAESGNHDQRVNEDDWGERYQGLVTKNADGTDSYDAEANQNFAKNLKGRLLLAHGTMDTNVPPYQTMLIADALIKANKDFDLILLPNGAIVSRHSSSTISGVTSPFQSSRTPRRGAAPWRCTACRSPLLRRDRCASRETGQETCRPCRCR
jgi:dienelactone hydrolase